VALADWKRLALRLAGAYARSRAWHGTRHVIEGVVAERPVRVSILERVDGSCKTRVVAAAPGAVGLRMRVARGHVYPLGRLLGIQDLKVDRPIFDARFVVKARDREFALAWLDDETCRLLLIADDARYHVEGERVVALHRGAGDDALVERIVHAVAALGNRGFGLRRDWETAAAALGGAVVGDGPWRPGGDVHIAREGAAGLAIDAFLDGGALWTRVRARRLSADPDAFIAQPEGDRAPSGLDPVFFSIGSLRVYAAASARTRTRLEGARALIEACAPRRVIADAGTVTVLFDGHVAAAERLAPAAALAEALAVDVRPTTAAGPFR
jgi:hypothetical protein